MRLQNDSLASDWFLVGAQANGPSTIGVQITRGDDDVTADILSGAYEASFNTGGVITLKVRMTIGAGTPKAAPFKLVFLVASITDPNKVDVVRAVAVR